MSESTGPESSEPEASSDVPTTIRRLEDGKADRLSRLVEAYDDLQTVLRACERLVTTLDSGMANADDVSVEGLWTLALLSYARAFAARDGVFALTADDLADEAGDGEPARWHQVFAHLRDRNADPATNPRETFTVGVALDDSGRPAAVAVSSVSTPPLDVAAVRRLGAMTYPLCAVLDERIDPLQKEILTGAQALSPEALIALEPVEVTTG